MNETELAWAAGFYDGEGSTILFATNGRRYMTVGMYIVQAGEGAIEILERFQLAVGVGKIYTQRIRNGRWQPQWRLQIQKKAEVELAILRLWPYLSLVKKKQILERFQELYIRQDFRTAMGL